MVKLWHASAFPINWDKYIWLIIYVKMNKKMKQIGKKLTQDISILLLKIYGVLYCIFFVLFIFIFLEFNNYIYINQTHNFLNCYENKYDVNQNTRSLAAVMPSFILDFDTSLPWYLKGILCPNYKKNISL